MLPIVVSVDIIFSRTVESSEDLIREGSIGVSPPYEAVVIPCSREKAISGASLSATRGWYSILNIS